jgi:hypothetical protein
MLHDGPLVAGMRTSIRFVYTAGAAGLPEGSRLRVGLPNTGWERPVAPQQRYWDELVRGADRRLAPFHPVNTTAAVHAASRPGHNLEVMERMLAPDEDPALAYWRWWITLTLEGAGLAQGDRLEILYGDRRFGSEGARIQTFAEPGINVGAYVDAGGGFRALYGTPVYFDVTGGAASRANVVTASVHTGERYVARIAITDECHCIPPGDARVMLTVGAERVECGGGRAAEVCLAAPAIRAVDDTGRLWGAANPSVPLAPDGLQLFWGDLHAQSEHHVMHSQGKDFRQETWSKGISCGTLDECYRYAREVALLDFVAITDQGACLTSSWEYCQRKVREYNEPGRFVTFKGYEAGSPLGHRNVIYLTDDVDAPLSAAHFNNFHPTTLFDYYRGRQDVLIIPHHVKTWTDWSYHDPELEPVMEVYSCWGQSESPGTDLWNKGQTPGAGAWEALRRGYRLGMMASSDNHVGMPGRSYPGDRQIHTPFKGGLCAVWCESLARESIFAALKTRRCYGTTGARIVVRFSISEAWEMSIEVAGTAALERVEVVHDLQLWRTIIPEDPNQSMLKQAFDVEPRRGFYYLRVFQKDGERAWTSPIWL